MERRARFTDGGIERREGIDPVRYLPRACSKRYPILSSASVSAAVAADETREAEAVEWSDALASVVFDEAR